MITGNEKFCLFWTLVKRRIRGNVNFISYSQEQEMKEEKGTGAEAESQSQLVAKDDNKGVVKQYLFLWIISL